MIDDDAEDGGEQQVVMDDAADPRQITRKANKAEKIKLEKIAFWKAVLANEIGRREVWGLLTDCHAFEERFACGPNGFPQTEATWFHAGEQAFGQRLYQTLCQMDLAGVMVMHEELDSRWARPKRQRVKDGG